MASLTDQIKDFSETPTGKIVVVAVPAVILALIIAFVALTMMRGNAQTGSETTGAETTETSSAVAAKDSTETAADSEDGSDEGATSVADLLETTTAYINENYEVYETRDPFEVYDTSAALTGSSGSSSNSSGGGSDTSGTAGTGGTGGGTGTIADAQTLMLEHIVDQDGVAYAVVKYGSISYSVKAGDQVGTSPYKVVSVGSDSATFLYGDDQVELAVGESVDK